MRDDKGHDITLWSLGLMYLFTCLQLARVAIVVRQEQGRVIYYLTCYGSCMIYVYPQPKEVSAVLVFFWF